MVYDIFPSPAKGSAKLPRVARDLGFDVVFVVVSEPELALFPSLTFSTLPFYAAQYYSSFNYRTRRLRSKVSPGRQTRGLALPLQEQLEYRGVHDGAAASDPSVTSIQLPKRPSSAISNQSCELRQSTTPDSWTYSGTHLYRRGGQKMADIIPLGMADGGIARRLDPQWNQAMITASLAISLLGAFTSTQLMCQARLSLNFSSVFVWTLLASLTFGFCSIWSLHEVAMLACELDLPIGIDVPLTIVSSLLAVFFTFAALASDLLWNRYTRSRKKRARQARRARREMDTSMMTLTREVSAKSLLRPSEEEEDEVSDDEDGSQEQSRFNALRRDSFEASNEVTPYHDIDDRPQSPKSDGSSMAADPESQINGLLPDNVTTLTRPTISPVQSSQPPVISSLDEYAESMSAVSESLRDSSSNVSGSRRSSSFMSSSGSSYGLGSMINTAYRRGTAGGKNAFLVTAEALYYGFDRKNIIKSFCWSLAITSMHYVGIAGLKIPSGYYTLNPGLFILSALISWVVCFAGCILMAQMETHLSQQFLFSFVATAGVAAMHFTGKPICKDNMDPNTDRCGRYGSCNVLVGVTAI